ncbi:hypothetical protein D0Z07_3112 [Hyphodiscus hymeniophilus]|uniref:2-dehydropantoate 2-reductase n=1 Tax=Hyphodiscus hymeniophilus TaxID=353542 RepID=A0A9P6VMM2_9HELO|nr:hypothetical protein D0Z07_3112 [Hyphodiscus hymeniophilus]
MRRHYNGHVTEGRRIDAPEEIPFVQAFPTKSGDKQSTLPRVLPNEGSGAAAAQDRGRAEVADGEERNDSSSDTADNIAPAPPISKEGFEHLALGNSPDDGLGSADGSQKCDQEQTHWLDESELASNLATESNGLLSHGVEDHAGRLNEEKAALERILRSREISSEVEEGTSPYQEPPALENVREWVPLEDRDSIEAERQPTLGVEPHIAPQANFDVESRAIHILGTGPTGKYVAQALASLPEAPPVILLMQTPLLMQQWHEEGASIQLLKNGKLNTTSNFNIESSSHIQRTSPNQRFPGFGEGLEHTAEPPDTVIDCLIITTEGHTTIALLSSIKHRLRRTSTICFIQDGLGVANLADTLVFPDPDSRPSYILGSMSHDLVSTPMKFTFYEKSLGKMYLTMARRNGSPHESTKRGPKKDELVKRIDYNWTPASTYLMRTLSRAYELGAVGLAETEFYEMQLQKLAVNAVIGPLSVMYDCFNDELLCNYQVSRSIRLLLKEISTILHRLPEISRSSKKEQRFSPENLERIIVNVLGKTGKNSTKMREAVRKGDRTDVDFYNGYLVNRAAELGIDCPHLEMTLIMVKAKQAMKSKEKNSLIPFKV